MQLIRDSQPSSAIIVAILALVAALAGTAIAGPDARTSAVTKKKVAKIATKQINKLAPGLSVASAGTANSARSADFASTAGSAAKAENVLSAAVNPDGTLARAGQPGTTSSRITGGQYEVDFGRDVSNCVWVAGISSVTAPTTDGQAQAGPRTGNIEAIFVLTTDSAGAITDKPFQVVAVC